MTGYTVEYTGHWLWPYSLKYLGWCVGVFMTESGAIAGAQRDAYRKKIKEYETQQRLRRGPDPVVWRG